MPVYKLNGKIYDIPDDVVADFENDNPDATISYSANGGKYDIPVSKRDSFLNAFPDATIDSGSDAGPGSTKQPMLDAMIKENSGGYQPSAEDMAGFMGTINNAGRVVSGSLQSFDRKTQNLQKRQGLNVPQRVNVGESNNLVQGEQKLNSETGKLENTYITASGEQYDNKTLADEEQRQIDKYERDQRYIESLPGQIEETIAEGKRLDEEIAKLREGSHGRLMDAMYGGRTEEDADADSRLSTLLAAKRKNDERLKILEAERDDNGGTQFWRGFYDAITNPDTYSFGVTGLSDATQMLKLKQKIDQANEQGVEPQFTEEEKALIRSVENNQYAQQVFGRNRGSMYSFGSGFAQSLPFMFEIAATGGMGGLSKIGFAAGKKAATKLATAAVEKTMIRNLGKGGQWLANMAIKGSGAMGGIAGGGLIMANTTGSAKTAADIIDRYVGDMKRDEAGNLKFEDGVSLGEAIYKGQLAQAFEYGSELVGDKYIEKYMPLIGEAAMRTIRKLGPEKARPFLEGLLTNKLTKGIGRIKNSRYFEKGEKALNYAGVQGWFAEGMEEEANNILNAIFVGDTTWFKQDPNKPAVLDTKDQLELWEQTVLTSAILRAPQMVTTTGKAAGYYSYKHATDVADAKAASVFGDNNWQMIREEIDRCTNEDLPALLETVVKGDMTQQQKEATMFYADNLLKMRGYNAALAAEGFEKKDEVDELIDDLLERGYHEGHQAELPDDLKSIADDARNAEEGLKQYGDNFATLIYSGKDHPGNALQYLLENRDTYTDDQIAAAADYYQKLARAEGMMDGTLDRIDTQVEKLNAEVRGSTHKATGNVVLAQNGDQQYYIIGGDILTDEAGNAVLAGTGGAVVAKNVQTGETKVMSPQQLQIQNIQSAEDMINFNNTAVRDQLIHQADEDITLGSPANETYQKDDTVTLQDADGNIIEGEIVGVPNAIDGAYSVQTNDKRPGKAVQYFTADQMNRMIVNHNGQEVQRGLTISTQSDQVIDQDAEAQQGVVKDDLTTEQPKPETSGNLDSATGETPTTEEGGETTQPQSASSRIPINAEGQPDYLQAQPQDSYDALVEDLGEDDANAIVESEISDAQKRLQRLEKQQPKGANIEEKKQNLAERRKAMEAEKAKIDYWNSVLEIPKTRKAEAERKAEEEERRRVESERKAKMQTSIGRQQLLEEANNNQERAAIAKEIYGDYFNENIGEPDTAEELVSLLLPYGQLNWEGFDRGGRHVRGLQEELGSGFTRGLAKDRGTSAFNSYLAKKGEGKSLDDIVHSMYENDANISGEGHRFTTEEIKDAAIGMLLSAEKPTDIRDYALNSRIDMAERTLRAELEAEMDAWAEANHLTPEERETYEDFLALQMMEGAETEYINQIIAENEEQNSRSETVDMQPASGETGADSEGGESQVQGQSTAEETGNDQEEPEAESGAEAGNGEPHVPDTDVSGGTQPGVDINDTENYSNISNGEAESENNDLPLPDGWERLPTNDVDNEETGEKIKGLLTLLKENYQDLLKAYSNYGRRDSGSLVGLQRARAALREELDRRDQKFKEWQKKYNIDKNGQISLEDLSRMFFDHNKSKIIGKLFGRVVEVARQIGLEIKFDGYLNAAGTSNYAGRIRYNTGNITSSGFNNQDIAALILHELIHSVTQSTVSAQKSGGKYAEHLTESQKKAAQQIIDVFNELKKWAEKNGHKDTYGFKSPHEMLAEMAKLNFRNILKSIKTKEKKTLWEIIKDAFHGIFSLTKETDAEKRVAGALDDLIENFSMDTFNDTKDYNVKEQWNTIGATSTPEEILTEEAKVDTNPTEAQKEAGNYQKGHIKVDGYDITIENPKGSVRRGTDKNGNAWEQVMNNTYGYIRGTEAVDGDHIDVFLSDDPTSGNVYVVDQVDPETGEFDESKVMYSFGSEEEAREAYLSNYEKGLGNITEVSREDFKKWIESSHRKTKPFAEYKSVKHKVEQQMKNFDTALKQLNTRGISIDNQELLDKYGLRNVVLSKTGDHLTLTHFIVDQQGQGYGTRFMEDLARLADEKGWTLALTPDTSFGGTSVKRLKDFYKRFGFVDNKGRNSDFYTRESMIRRPKEFLQSPEKQEKVIRDAVVEYLRSKGVEVNTDWKLGQKILDEYNGKEPLSRSKKRAIETAPLNPKEGSPADISTADGAKIQKNLESYANSLEKVVNRRKNFISEVAQNLGAKQDGSDSWYRTFTTPNGLDVTFRLGNHNATVSNFDFRDEDNGISIVVSKRSNEGIKNDGNAHIVEFFYPEIALRKAYGKPLAEIVRSIKDAIKTGEYKDPTGLAEREEVNAEEIRQHKVYHGSGAEFDAFDHSHMGEGAGSQTFGYGTYVTNSKRIGTEYANVTSRGWLYKGMDGKELRASNDKVPEGRYYSDNEIRSFVLDYMNAGDSFEQAVDKVRRNTQSAINDHEEHLSELSPSELKDLEGFRQELKLINSFRPEDFKRDDRYLYDVEIPEENGSYYIDYYGKMGEQKDVLDMVDNALTADGWKRQEIDSRIKFTKGDKQIILTPNQSGADLYAELEDALGSDRAASKFLNNVGVTGIKYPAGTIMGGGDGATNYVIFNEGDAKITDRTKFFKTPDGHAYGYTYKGKVYLDPRIATSETPVHEYGHLWCEMKRQTAPEEWEQMKQVMLNDEVVKPIIERVKRDYEELTKEGREDDFVEEVITQFSGKRGSERLREIANEVAAERGGVFGKAEAVTAMQRLKNILNQFWEGVARMMGWKYRNANQIADRIMADMLNGVNPREQMKEAANGRLRSQAEVERTLMGVHNLSEDKLRKVLKQGGLANPSLAVVDTKNHMHTDYGSISLIPKASLIDARTGRNAGTFTADAWTPTYPTVQKRMSDKGQDKFWKDLRTLREEDGEIANKTRMAFDTWLDKEVGQERLAYWYLKEKGLNPETATFDNPYGKEVADRLDALTDDGNKEVRDLAEEEIKEVADMYYAYMERIGEPVAPAEDRIKMLQARMDPGKPSPFLKLQQSRLDELQKYGELLHTLNDFSYKARRAAFEAGKVDADTSMRKAQETLKQKGLQQDFDKWLQDKADSYGIEEWLYNGTDDRTGEQKWVRNTLENASRLMKKEGLNGAVNWSSIGNWIAKVARSEKTLAGIRKNKKNLQTTEEEHEAFREKWSQVMYDIATKLGKGDSWSGENIMSDILDHKDYASYLKREYGMELSKEDREAIDTFINEVQTNYPTGYFETKFERPVMLDEFEIAVVPENTSPDIVEALKNAGLDVRTYDNTGTEDQNDANRTQATMDAVQGRDDIMFQMVGKEGAAEADRAEGNDERSRNLTLAEESEKAGVDAKAIKLATGWERGADGQWRYEIPDADVDVLSKYRAKVDEMKKEGVKKPQPIIKLGELLGEDNELFKYYPDLRNTDVLFSDTLPDGTAGSFDGTNIELNAKELNRFEGDDLNNENVYGTLLHEVQHAIQEKEGFAQGGNLQTSTTEDGINAIIEKKERQRADIKTRLDANNKILSDPENLKMSAELEGKTEKEVRDQLTETVDQQAALYDTLGLQIERLRHTKAPSMTDARDLYHRLAGEVESRNVTERMGMTGEQRRQSLASETEDVPREDQVIIDSNENENNSLKFSIVGSPEPENERPRYQNGEDALHYAERLAEYERKKKMGSPDEEPVNMARQIYEDAIRDTGDRMMIPSMLASIFNKETRERFKHKFAESWFDYSRSIKALQDAIGKATGNTIQGFEDVWRTLNAKSSIDNDQIQRVMHDLIEPLSEFVGNMVRDKEIDGHRMTIDDVEKYMNAVHGIERNIGMAKKQATDEYEENIAMQKQQLESGELKGKERKSVEDALLIKEARFKGIKNYMDNEVVAKWYSRWNRRLENARANRTITDEGYNKARKEMDAEYENGWQYKYRNKDYSGLTALFADDFKDKKPTEDQLEQAAKDYADKFEKIVGKESADGLWQRVKALNEWSLRKSYESGLISRDQMNDTLSMYRHYIPLRGWHDDYAGDVYQYISRGEPAEVLQGVLKNAYGRKSRAARIFGTMAAMANTAIVQGNKNLVAQHLLNMALNHRDAGLLMPSEQYYQKNADGQMVPQMPALNDNMTPEEMRQELERFEAEMKAKEDAGEVQTLRSKFRKEFPLHMAKWQEQRHAVRVMRNGKEYMVYILGNPRAAEAFNGLLNPNSQPGAISNVVNMWNRWLAKWQTSLSPEFLFSNFQRDVMTATTGAYIKYGNDYKRQFEKNILSVMPLTKATLKKLKGEEAKNLGGIFSLFRKYDSGTLDMNDETERMFKEFIEGGGMTGISHITKAEEYQESMEKMVRRMRQGKMDNVRKGWKAIGDGIEFLNKGIENATRFATYMTSRQQGRSIRESIFDAKEASVNFNMKGSGAWGNMMARRLYLYVNPAMQALRMLGTWYENDPVVATKEGGKMAAKAVGKRFLKTAAGVVTASVTCAIVNKLLSELLHGDDGDDDDKEKGDWWALSEWNRYNYINVINPFGKGYFHWSIPQELRPLWAMGQIAVDMAFGRKTWQRGLQSMVLQLNNLSPLSFFEGGTDGGETVIESELRTMTPSFLAPFFDAYFWNRDFMGHKITNRHSFNEDDPEWQRAGDDTPKVVVNASRKLNNITGGADNSRGWLEDNILGGTTNPSALYYLATQQFGGVGSMAKRLFNLIDQATDDEKEVELRNIPFVPKVYVSTGDDHSKQRVLNDKFWMYYSEYKGADHEFSKNEKDVKAKKMTQEYADKRIEERKADGTYNTWKIFEDNDFEYIFKNLRGSKDEDEVKRMVVDAIENGKMPDYEAMLSDPNRNADNDGLFYKVRMRQIEHKVDDMKPEEAFAEFDKTKDPRMRKELAKRISKDAGATEDPYGDKPSSDHAYQYQIQRTAEDVREDALLYALQEQLRNDDKEREKDELSKERKKAHSSFEFLHGGRSDVKYMDNIREERKRLMKKYGLLKEEKITGDTQK